MRTTTIPDKDMATLKVMLKYKPKQKPKFQVGERVIVHVSGRLIRCGIVTEVPTARQMTYAHIKADIERDWLRPEALLEKVKHANQLYGSPWVYFIEYDDGKDYAKAQWIAVRDIRKYEGLNKILYGTIKPR